MGTYRLVASGSSLHRWGVRGTPDHVVTRINPAVNKVLKDKALWEKIGRLEFTVAGGAPEEAAALGARRRSSGERRWRRSASSPSEPAQ